MASDCTSEHTSEYTSEHNDKSAGADDLPIINADPFVLRGFEPRDTAFVVAAATDDYIPLLTTLPADAEAEEARAFVERQRHRLRDGYGYSYVITNPAVERGIGSVGLWLRDSDEGRASIGYWVVEGARGRGAAAAACRALSRWALIELVVARVELVVEPWNVASIRTAETAGFLREGLLRSHQQVGSERRDMYLYSLVPEDLV